MLRSYHHCSAIYGWVCLSTGLFFPAVFSEDFIIARFYDAWAIADHQCSAACGEYLADFPFNVGRSLVAETDVGIGVNTLERNPFHVWILILRVLRHVFCVTLYLLLGPLEIPCDRLSAEIRLDAVPKQRKRFEIRINMDDDFEFWTLLFDIVDDVVVVIYQLPKIEVVFVFRCIF